LKRFGANIFVQIEAEDLEEAKAILDKIVNADFGKKINDRIEAMSFHDPISDDYDIWEMDDP